MARRIRWQILIAALSSALVLGLMGYLAVTNAAVSRPLAGGAYVEGLPAIPQQLNPLLSDPARDPAAADVRALLFDGLMRIGSMACPSWRWLSRWCRMMPARCIPSPCAPMFPGTTARR